MCNLTEKRAASWYLKAAEQGHVSAQFNLAKMYALGEGVTTDKAFALAWLIVAASNGDKQAGEFRDLLKTMMSREQVDEAQRLAMDWRSKGVGQK